MTSEITAPQDAKHDEIWAGDIRTAEIAAELRQNAQTLRSSIR